MKTKKNQAENANNLPDVEILNNYFLSVGSLLSKKIQETSSTFPIEMQPKTMLLSETNEQEISKILCKMKNKKSAGYDGISNEILKCCSPIIECYLAKAVNKCITEEIFPECLKVSKVIPLHKKGDKKEPGNYRPISLLSPLSKIFESVLLKRMLGFSEKCKLLSLNQFGFRPKKSCIHAIAKITEYIRDSIDRKETGQACFVDLSKAFDTIDHSILLRKLEINGFRGKIFNLIETFLTNRLQYIDSLDKTSKKGKVLCGVPQGSVLGPFLFLLYINDLDNACTESSLTMFADDTTVIKAGRRTDSLIREDVKVMTHWFDANKLTINVDKCEAIHFGRGIPDEVQIKDNHLHYKPCCKYLGVYIDPTLTFRDHIDYVVKKLNKFCGLIYHVRHLYPKKCLLMFYNAYAKSIITYGLLIYGAAAKPNLSRIESVQRRILRAIFFRKRQDSLQEILAVNKINTVYELFLNEVVSEVFKEMRSDSPLKLLDFEKLPKSNTTTRWNSKGVFAPIASRTVVKKKCLANSLMKAYNWLTELNLIPPNLLNLSQEQLKKHLKLVNDLYITDNKELFCLYFCA